MKHVMGIPVAIIGLFIFCGVARGADPESLRTELDATNLANVQLRQENDTLRAEKKVFLEDLQPKLSSLTQNVNSLIHNNGDQKREIDSLKQKTDSLTQENAALKAAAQQEKAKLKNCKHYYARNERAWECSLGLTGFMAVKAYTPQIFYTAGTKVASYMPAFLTKYSASAISFCSPYALPAIGVAAALWLIKNIGTDMHKNWALDKTKFIEEKKVVGENTNLGCKLSCQLLWHRFAKHTSKNVETILAPAVTCVAGLRYLRR